MEENTRDDNLYAGMNLQELPFVSMQNNHGEMQTYYLDVIAPMEEATVPRPVVFFIHGGGFMSHCDKRQGYIPVFARALTEAGYAVISPDYPVCDDVEHRDRIGGSKGAALRAAEAVHAAYQYVQAHAQQLQLDPTRVAIMGGSAGGMTAFEAIASYNDAYRLFVNCWGTPRYEMDLKGFPPVLSIHGTADQLVAYELEAPIQEQLQRLGIRHELLTLEGSRHTPMDRFDEFIPSVMAYLSDTMN